MRLGAVTCLAFAVNACAFGADYEWIRDFDAFRDAPTNERTLLVRTTRADAAFLFWPESTSTSVVFLRRGATTEIPVRVIGAELSWGGMPRRTSAGADAAALVFAGPVSWRRPDDPADPLSILTVLWESLGETIPEAVAIEVSATQVTWVVQKHGDVIRAPFGFGEIICVFQNSGSPNARLRVKNVALGVWRHPKMAALLRSLAGSGELEAVGWDERSGLATYVDDAFHAKDPVTNAWTRRSFHPVHQLTTSLVTEVTLQPGNSMVEAISTVAGWNSLLGALCVLDVETAVSAFGRHPRLWMVKYE